MGGSRDCTTCFGDVLLKILDRPKGPLQPIRHHVVMHDTFFQDGPAFRTSRNTTAPAPPVCGADLQNASCRTPVVIVHLARSSRQTQPRPKPNPNAKSNPNDFWDAEIGKGRSSGSTARFGDVFPLKIRGRPKGPLQPFRWQWCCTRSTARWLCN